MKLSDFTSIDQPAIATFEETGDSHTGTIVKEPEWQDDPRNPDRKVLVIVLRTDQGIYRQINARTQMPDAIFNAVTRAGVEELAVGGRLTVTFSEYRGQAKIYTATYEPPEESAAPSWMSEHRIGTAELGEAAADDETAGDDDDPIFLNPPQGPQSATNRLRPLPEDRESDERLLQCH
jgi:hypothetical protein